MLCYRIDHESVERALGKIRRNRRAEAVGPFGWPRAGGLAVIFLAGGLALAGIVAPAAAHPDSDPGVRERARELVAQMLTPARLVTEGDLEAARAKADRAEGKARLAALLRSLRLARLLHDPQAIESGAAELQKAAEAAGSRRFQVLAEAYDAFALAQYGKLSAGLDALERLKRRESDSQHWMIKVLIRQFIADVAPALGQVHRATAALQNAFDLVPQEGARARRVRADLHIVFGYVDMQLHDLAATTEQFARALELGGGDAFRIDRVAMAYYLANGLLAHDDVASARRAYGRLLETGRRIGRGKIEYYGLHGLARVEQQAGHPKLSARFAEQAIIFHEAEPHFAAATAQIQAGNMIELGRLDAARAYMAIAKTELAAWPDLDETRFGLTNLRLESDLAEAEGRHAEALETFRSYASQRREFTERVFDEDVKALRTTLENDLAMAQTQKALAEQQKQAAQANLQLQRFLLLGAGALILLAAAGLIYQRRVARALNESRRKAEAANRAKSTFLANVSHELRTPLNAIIGFSEVVSKEMLGPLGNDTYRSHADSIHRAGRHLLSVINDILDIARIEAGRVAFEEEEIALADLVRDAAEMLTPTLESKGLALRQDGLEDAPRLYGDPRVIRQCLTNLLSNAVKFSESGGRIDVQLARNASGELTVSVTDGGRGMSQAEVATALEPFGQAEPAFTRTNEGTGLGLPLVNALMGLHGGRLEIESTKGVGTTARLVFPAERIRPADGQSQELPLEAIA